MNNPENKNENQDQLFEDTLYAKEIVNHHFEYPKVVEIHRQMTLFEDVGEVAMGELIQFPVRDEPDNLVA